MKEENLKSMNSLALTENKLEQALTDTKYWLAKYADSHRESERTMYSVKSGLEGKIDALDWKIC